jgi:general secretion pathway protein F
MRFVVRALDAQQQVAEFTVEALDENDARAQAQARRLSPLSVHKQIGNAPGSGFALLLFAQELHALLDAGLSVIEALEVLTDKENAPGRRLVLERLASHLRQGMRLSAAMQQQAALFPPLLVGVVQAAEGTSNLPEALARYIGYENRVDQVRHKIVGASIYPAILLVVGGAVTLFLLGYVVPRFASVYQGSGRTLPWASELLLGWGRALHAHGLAAGTVVAAAAAAAGLWTRARLRDGGVWRMAALLPGAGPRVRVVELSRLYLTLGMLLEGGISLHAAMGLAGGVLSAPRAQALEAARRDVAAGSPLSDALQLHGLATPVAQRLLRVGERSGQLGPMLSRTAAFHDGEVSRWVERFARTFEPVLMVGMGSVIGLIVILLYMPVFDLAGSLP